MRDEDCPPFRARRRTRCLTSPSATDDLVHRRILAVLHGHVRRRQVHVATHHLQRRVPEDLLETEHVATVDQVARREGVPAEVRMEARDARPRP